MTERLVNAPEGLYQKIFPKMGTTEFSINDISINNDIVIKTSFSDGDMKDLIIRNAVKEHVTNLIYNH